MNRMAGTPQTVTVIEHCRVAPRPGEMAELSLPLSFFDIAWLNFPLTRRLLFYEFPVSTTHFLQTIVPNLKSSLSLTLKHFIPIAGNIIYPLNSDALPMIRYISGDSVSVTIAEYNRDSGIGFNLLTANSPRNADEFYAFLPELPPEKIESGSKIIPLLAVQVTLFPDSGVCIGITNNHTLGDASSTTRFVKAWSSIAKYGGDEVFLSGNSQPIFDRSLVKYPSELDTIYWNQIKSYKSDSAHLNFSTNKVLSTFILREDHIKKLRESILAKRPNGPLLHLSSFSITCAYVWTCLAKLADFTEEMVNENEPEYFVFAADCRPRLEPPVPAEYFGNCVGLGVAESTHGLLKGEEGFVAAVESIGEVIKKVSRKGEILEGAENWLVKVASLGGKRVFRVAGSPKFDVYDADNGWGRPRKYECVSIDAYGAVSLSKCGGLEGGLEIGLSFHKTEMDAFGAIFTGDLEML